MAAVQMTERARDVMEIARREAGDLRHDHVGTEHVLLGILREGGGIASRLTELLHLRINQIRKGVAMLNPVSPTSWTSHNQLPFTHHLRAALKSAEGTAQQLGHEGIGIGHLFLGVIEDAECKGALLLINLGLDLKETRRELLEALSRPLNQ